jgi:carboxylesterase type B
MYGWGHEFGPEILMDRDIIWVTINYRLGFFGKIYKSFIKISKSNYKRILNST